MKFTKSTEINPSTWRKVRSEDNIEFNEIGTGGSGRGKGTIEIWEESGGCIISGGTNARLNASASSPCKQAIIGVAQTITKFTRASEWITFIESCAPCNTWKTRLLNMKNKSQKITYKGVEVNIPFNCFGFPIFDDFMKFLPKFEGFLEIDYDNSTTSEQDRIAATNKLKTYYRNGIFPFESIDGGKRIKVGDEYFTWHHHEDTKTMQLVPSEIHQKISHRGGRYMVETNLIEKLPKFRSRLNCN